MPDIEEFDVVIKTYTMQEIRLLLGEGKKDTRLVMLSDANHKFYPVDNWVMKVETWEPKNKDKK